MESEERSDAVQAGQVRAIAEGKLVGRPRVIVDPHAVLRLRDSDVEPGPKSQRPSASAPDRCDALIMP